MSERTKYLWEMTKIEYFKHVKIKYGSGSQKADNAAKLHRRIVLQAIEDGEVVHKNILECYENMNPITKPTKNK